jgi:hypothetical protein
LDGRSTGKKTPYAESVEVGDHSISLSLEGYRSVTASARVEKGEKAEPNLALEAIYGEIVCNVRPTAKIYLDGVYIFDTPRTKSYQVQAGRHVLTIVNEAYCVDKRVSIEVKEGETTAVEEVLTKSCP